MRKVLDTVYWEMIDGSINSGKIVQITEHSECIRYEVENDDLDTVILEDHNCLSKDDPRVQEYIKKENKGLWITRYKNQALVISDVKPVLQEGVWRSLSRCNWWELPAEMYPEVTFENSPKKLRV